MQSKCKVIAVASQKGGAGKTTATEHSGIGSAKPSKTMLLIDLDPQANLNALLCLQKKLKNISNGNDRDCHRKIIRKRQTDPVCFFRDAGIQ